MGSTVTAATCPTTWCLPSCAPSTPATHPPPSASCRRGIHWQATSGGCCVQRGGSRELPGQELEHKQVLQLDPSCRALPGATAALAAYPRLPIPLRAGHAQVHRRLVQPVLRCGGRAGSHTSPRRPPHLPLSRAGPAFCWGRTCWVTMGPRLRLASGRGGGLGGCHRVNCTVVWARQVWNVAMRGLGLDRWRGE